MKCDIFPLDMCLYKGGLHPQGSNWQDGCDFTCYCVDAMSNSYRCQARSVLLCTKEYPYF